MGGATYFLYRVFKSQELASLTLQNRRRYLQKKPTENGKGGRKGNGTCNSAREDSKAIHINKAVDLKTAESSKRCRRSILKAMVFSERKSAS